MALLIDTDVLIDAERIGAALDSAFGNEPVGISVVTVSELMHGVHRATGTVRSRRTEFVEQLLSAYLAVPITEAVALLHARVWAALEERGSMIGAHDLWIAATALTHDLGLVTRNVADFGRVPNLRVIAL